MSFCEPRSCRLQFVFLRPLGPPTYRRSLLPTIGAGILALLFLAAAWFAAGRGIITDTWPAFLPDTDSTSIIRYSGPWLTAAAAAALGAGLCVMALVRRLTTR